MMNGNLSCGALNCVHNLGGLCSANKITVNGRNAQYSGGTECSTFATKGIVNSITHITNMNIPGEIKQVFNNDDIYMYPAVGCTVVNCKYNRENLCEADRVMIMGTHASSSDATYCDTFDVK